jgi:hypothetical protein
MRDVRWTSVVGTEKRDTQTCAAHICNTKFKPKEKGRKVGMRGGSSASASLKCHVYIAAA